MAVTTESCDTCKYYSQPKPPEPKYQECLRYPPDATGRVSRIYYIRFCGEYVPAK